MVILAGTITNEYLNLASIYKQSNMANNFLVHHISKRTARFFASASIAIGILSTIGLSYSRVWADSFDTSNISSLAQIEIDVLSLQGRTTNNIVVFPPNGGFGIVYDNNTSYTYLFPQELLNALSAIKKQGGIINSIVFTPSGQWIVIYNGYGAYWSTNFPQDVVKKILQINKQQLTINSVAFTPYGGWVIIYGNNSFYYSTIPQELVNKIVVINKVNHNINSIRFTNKGEWIIISNNGLNIDWSTNFPQPVRTAINNVYANSGLLRSIAFTPNNGWVLYYSNLMGLSKLLGTWKQGNTDIFNFYSDGSYYEDLQSFGPAGGAFAQCSTIATSIIKGSITIDRNIITFQPKTRSDQNKAGCGGFLENSTPENDTIYPPNTSIFDLYSLQNNGQTLILKGIGGTVNTYTK